MISDACSYPQLLVFLSTMPAHKKQKSTKEASASSVEIAEPERVELDYINLTTHPDGSAPIAMNWGHTDPMVRS